ncbi:MAG TPA: hypothetical protein VI248_16205 [Kineosporiaceae bacterium]
MLTLRSARMAFSTLVVVLAATLTGCSVGGPGGGGGSGAAGAGPVGSARARQVLTQSAVELRALVNALSAPASGRQAPYVACPSAAGGVFSTTPACTGFDTQGPCLATTADQTWPQRWGYNVNLQLGKDALDAGTAAVQTLARQHWATKRNPSTTFVRDFSARLNGVSLRIVADDMPGVLTLEGYGPCVNVDGSTRAA